jgi:phosphoribosylaminoimidazole (AIR) synthetase
LRGAVSGGLSNTICPDEMVRTFNCGIGLVLVVAWDKVGAVMQLLGDADQKEVFTVGEVVTSSQGVEILNAEQWNE